MLCPMPDPASVTTWPSDRISERFAAVDADLSRLEQDIRVYAPVVPVLSEAVSRLKTDVQDLEAEVKVIVNRSVTRQLVIVSTPLFFAAVALIITLLSLGKLG
jgi:hypothetical protein